MRATMMITQMMILQMAMPMVMRMRTRRTTRRMMEMLGLKALYRGPPNRFPKKTPRNTLT